MTSTTIIRAAHGDKHPYFPYRRHTAQDRALSWEARGVLAYLLSKSDNWQVVPKDLMQNCGRDKVRKILEELCEHRYMRKEQTHDEEGKFSKVVYWVYEVPFTENPLTVDEPLPEKPLTEKPSPENPLHTINETVESTESKEQDSDASASGGECVDGWPEGVQKHVAIIDAYCEALKESGKEYIGKNKYSRFGDAANALIDAGKTPPQVYEATRALYTPDFPDPWLRDRAKAISLEEVGGAWGTLWTHALTKRPKPRIVVDLGTMEDIKRRQSESRARIIARAEAGEIGQLNEEADDAAA